MHRAAQHLLGEHDFSSFRAAGCQSTTPMRRVNRCSVSRHGNLVVMEIEANAFEPWRQVYFHQQLQQMCERLGCEANENRLVPLQEAEAKGS